MSHELTMIGERADMAYIGETPWHKLGQKVDPTATPEEWAVASGLNFKIERAVVQYAVEVVNPLSGKPMVETKVVPGRVVLHRSDTKAALSVMSRGYKEVQPAQALSLFKRLIDTGGYQMETAGSLRGGAKVWAMVRTGQGFSLPGGDDVEGRLLFATACDGSMATTVCETTICVVCANTLAAAIEDQGKRVARVSHSTRFDPEAVLAKLRKVSESFDAFESAAEALAKTRLDSANAAAMLELILPKTDSIIPVAESRSYKAIMALFEDAGIGSNLPSRAGTAWGLVNAVTEYVDHAAPSRSSDNRLSSAWFGNGDKLKSRALAVAVSAL